MIGRALRGGLACGVVFALALGCQAPVVPGQACARSSDCSSPLVCRFGRCRSECTVNRDCPAGSSCLTSPSNPGACSVDVDLGCETGVGRMCPSGLTCVADRCVATCSMPSDCPSDGECRPSPVAGVSFCFDPRVPTLDAGVPDDAALDAAAIDTAAIDTAVDAGPPNRCTSLCIQGYDTGGTGGERACAVCNGAVLCWGYDGDDGLGDGPGGAAMMGFPAAVKDDLGTPLGGMVEVACGDSHACALDASGGVYCWGRDTGGHGIFLSRPSTSDHAQPAAIGFGADAIAAGMFHTCARDRVTHAISCWGENVQGQCSSDPSLTYVETAVSPTASHPTIPLQPFTTETSAEFGGGFARTCSVATATPDTLHCVGLGEFGNTGSMVELVTARGTPSITAAGPITELTMGRAHECLLAGPLDQRRVYCVGADNFGALGVTDATSLPTCGALHCAPTPRLVDSATMYFEHVASGPNSFHTCASVAAGGVWCWGSNDAGQCGQSASSSVPVSEVASMRGLHVTHLATGLSSTCAIVDGGAASDAIYCWGANDASQLGRGAPDALAHAEAMPVMFP